MPAASDPVRVVVTVARVGVVGGVCDGVGEMEGVGAAVGVRVDEDVLVCVGVGVDDIDGIGAPVAVLERETSAAM